ncbi:single-stranded DNA-binding protein [Caloramator australicus]|uniref:Single-stranded DNA-binding protein n=1 Tax=Caloramator australicus RC3 TaxID=857293 RepID=I7LFZ3_9CLOT|nr:single-stranded DNA-binding protein [Caloramator australicus]CCJ32870.1 Single-stranded DNA-binding protein [Caloramator australicus RC3]
MNHVVLIGRLTSDPKLAYMPNSGIAVTRFNLAVERNFKNEKGKKDVDFIPIICFRKLAEIVANNLTKGRLISIHGSILTRKYQAQDGTNRFVTEVLVNEVKFLDKPKNKNSDLMPTDESISADWGNEDDIPF